MSNEESEDPESVLEDGDEEALAVAARTIIELAHKNLCDHMRPASSYEFYGVASAMLHDLLHTLQEEPANPQRIDMILTSLGAIIIVHLGDQLQQMHEEFVSQKKPAPARQSLCSHAGCQFLAKDDDEAEIHARAERHWYFVHADDGEVFSPIAQEELELLDPATAPQTDSGE